MSTAIVNARIAHTFLGREDHGIFTIVLTLDGGGWGQGAGGVSLDEPIRDSAGKFLGRVPTTLIGKHIIGIIDTLGVDQWEKVQGQHVRAERVGGTIARIGHITENRWFNLRTGTVERD